ncbi:MAG: hypothetical protein R3C68_17330 [Myxococcota bacterium]
MPDHKNHLGIGSGTLVLLTTLACSNPASLPKPSGVLGNCTAATLGTAITRQHLLIGGDMSDEAFSGAPFDVRHQYIASFIPTSGPCDDCASGCFVQGASCANSAGCSWWGCWQWDQLPPGQYVTDFVLSADAAGAIPMFTYYVWLNASGAGEGQAEIAALKQGDRVAAYMADYRLLNDLMGAHPSIPIILQIEPDLWGYGQLAAADPKNIEVNLSLADAPECAELPHTLAGFSRCLIAITRLSAPNVLIGLHASPWGPNIDAMLNSNPQFDLQAHAQSVADFHRALGSDATDLVMVSMSDRDAGFDGDWWDKDNHTLPHFTQALTWSKALSEALELPHLWWQVPYGNPRLNDTCGRYRDNRLDYVFDHASEFAAAGALGVVFGSGTECMTTPSTDNGHFVDRADDYYTETRPFLCFE